jgi:hypothetical protein
MVGLQKGLSLPCPRKAMGTARGATLRQNGGKSRAWVKGLSWRETAPFVRMFKGKQAQLIFVVGARMADGDGKGSK